MKVYIKYFEPDLVPLKKIAEGDWIDLRSAEDVELKAGEFRYIRLGVGMILPEGERNTAAVSGRDSGYSIPSESRPARTPRVRRDRDRPENACNPDCLAG